LTIIQPKDTPFARKCKDSPYTIYKKKVVRELGVFKLHIVGTHIHHTRVSGATHLGNAILVTLNF
jgi:hypothetical protein